MTMPNPGVWFEIYVDDITRARNFYETLLGVTLEQIPSPKDGTTRMLAFANDHNATGIGGALVKDQTRRPSAEGSLIYLSCDNVAETAALAGEMGAPVYVHEQSIGAWGFIAIIGDSEGNVIGLHAER